MLQLSSSPLKVAKMAEFYLAHLDAEYDAKVKQTDELEKVRRERQARHLRRSQSTSIIGRAAYSVFDLFQRDREAS